MSQPLTVEDIDAIVDSAHDYWTPIVGSVLAGVIANAKRSRLEARTETDPTDDEQGGLPAAWAQSRRDTTANPSRKDADS